MGNTIIEKILMNHSGEKDVKPDQIVDVEIDVRAARDFGGANVVKNLKDNALEINNNSKTFFTFDCNPGGSDQKYAANQQICRMFAREKSIKVFDVDAGIGTHIAVDDGLVGPGGTLISTDSHANILGAIGAFGQGMGDQDIASAFAHGKVWFKTPKSLKITLKGLPPKNTTAKDITLKLLSHFGANGLLGYAAEIYGDHVNKLSVSERITISSMATEMGGIIIFFPPNDEVIIYSKKQGAKFNPIYADSDAKYENSVEIDIRKLEPMVSLPGHPEDVINISALPKEIKIDSVFIGSCTNGRFEDFLEVAGIFKNRKIAPGVVCKIVPSTKKIFSRLLSEGYLEIFSKAGCLISNPGCAGCAAGQIGQNGPGEITISTGNRNFAGKQGKGEVYLASPASAAATAIAGYITTADKIPDKPKTFSNSAATYPAKSTGASELAEAANKTQAPEKKIKLTPPLKVKGRAWIIDVENIDTDMIFHNRYLTITDINEMGKHAFDNLKGFEDFAKKVQKGDIIFTAKNFGCGSSRQQAVDCFKALGVSVIIANSFGAIYERNAINAALPIVTHKESLKNMNIKQSDIVEVDLEKGTVTNTSTGAIINCSPMSGVQMEIYERGGLLE